MKKLTKNIDLDKLIDKNSYAIMGVSTGIDSMCLFHYLNKMGYRMVVAHINHKKRIESDQEYLFLKDYCEKNGVPFEGYVLDKKIKGNFQEEARYIRYDFFKKVADKYHTKQIVVSHQADDQIETILMRLSRGTSVKGYHGMDLISYMDDYKILRPLLFTPRKNIEEYQKEYSVPFFEDRTNGENHYTRNIIRHNIVPVLKDLNPALNDAFINYSNDLYDVYSLVDRLSEEFMKKYAKILDECISIPISEFEIIDDIIKRQVILKCINILSNNTILATHERLGEIAKFSVKTSANKLIEISNDLKATKEYENLKIYRVKEKEQVYLEIKSFGSFLTQDGRKVTVSQDYHRLPDKSSYMLCYNDIQSIFPIYIRNWKDGDKIKINGITKKVSNVLKDFKVPKSERYKILVVSNSNGIFFIPNYLRKETDKSLNSILYISVEEN